MTPVDAEKVGGCEVAEVRSVFFEHCLGVFQGGGCRGAALAGAYKAAIECGVNFAEVAGTSAGSIMAALVGANAKPEDVCEKVGDLEFKRFLGKAERHGGCKGIFWRIGGRFLCLIGLLLFWKKPKWLGRVALYGGIYSSKPLEDWMNEELSSLLPDARGAVKFRDLPIPTRIVATDLSTYEAKIWGTQETPDESVAFAVRASCSIPFFFQPAVQGNNRFVDGGLLSNLPAFVYASTYGDGPSVARRILAFRLREDVVFPKQWVPSELLKRLIAAVIDGATELQNTLQGNVYSITIPTAGVKATDFEKITSEEVASLMEAGRAATLQFLRKEGRHVYHDGQINNFCQDRDEAYYAFVEEAESPLEEVLIAEHDTKWFWKLFPTILHWRMAGIPVMVVLGPISGSNHERSCERARREILRGMEISVHEVNDVKIAGYTFKRRDASKSTAIVLGQQEDEFAPFATRYSGKAHGQVISSVRETVLGQLEGIRPSTNALSCVSMEAADVVALITAGVAQYSKDGIQIELVDVCISQIDMLTKYVRGYKYKQIARLIDIYRVAGIDLFSAMKVISGQGFSSPVGPPVIEAQGDRFVAIEGHTRIYYCWRNKIKSMKCLVVRNVSDSLPAEPVKLEEVQIASREMPPNERMPHYNHTHFRSIERALRPL